MNLDAASFQEALDRSQTIVIFANCSVKYSGRAESFLPDGDRIIVIKSDKTLLVHQPFGSTPVNYMKESTIHKLVQSKGQLILKSSNLLLKEYMDILLNKVHSFNFHDMEDTAKIQLVGSEKDMSEMIYNNPGLIEKGFKPVSMEEQTRYGFIDVFGYDKNNVLVIVECKRYSADFRAVEQLKRYVDKVKQSKGIDKARGIIAAPKIAPNALDMLTSFHFEFRAINPPKYLEKFDSGQKRIGEYEEA